MAKSVFDSLPDIPPVEVLGVPDMYIRSDFRWSDAGLGTTERWRPEECMKALYEAKAFVTADGKAVKTPDLADVPVFKLNQVHQRVMATILYGGANEASREQPAEGAPPPKK